ncbi:MAG: hypothetical protein ABSH46_19070 [Bryobacteraceae bacterium]|jgi:hypothetical protein
MRLRLLAYLVLPAISAIAQGTPKSIALTDKSTVQGTPKSIALTYKSTVPPEDISKALRKECPSVSITSDVAKSDYTLEVIRTDLKTGQDSFDLTLIDRDGKTFRTASTPSLANAMKDVCHAIFIATGGQRSESSAPPKQGKTAVVVEVVDTQNLTLDARGGGIVGGIVGRTTHTDTSTIHVIVNGEHALLDCYERRKGCTTIGPGRYYGELEGESVWVNYEMPLTHKAVRNHYRIAGSW